MLHDTINTHKDCRKTFYKGCEVIKNPHGIISVHLDEGKGLVGRPGVAQQSFYKSVDVLEKWEVPPINEVNRKLKKIEISLKRQEESIDEVRFVLSNHNTLHACAVSINIIIIQVSDHGEA